MGFLEFGDNHLIEFVDVGFDELWIRYLENDGEDAVDDLLDNNIVQVRDLGIEVQQRIDERGIINHCKGFKQTFERIGSIEGEAIIREVLH